jgi:hypothetical protein
LTVNVKKYLDYEGLQTYHTNLCNIIEDNEQVTSAALNDLDGRLKEIESENPSAVTESTVSGWGFTKNTGTVTGVKMNGTTKPSSSGVVDLGTVITAHQDISGKADKSTTLAGYGITNAYTKTEIDTIITDNELVVSSALNDLNIELSDKANKSEDLDGIKIKKITQSAYDALVQEESIDLNTLYFIY